MRRDGFVLDAPPLLISRDPWDHFSPDIAGGAGSFLVGWRTYRWHGAHSPVYSGASVGVVDANGTVGETVMLEALTAFGNLSAPQIAWNGNIFLAAWSSRGLAFAALVPPSGSFVAIGERVPGSNVKDAAFLDDRWMLVTEDQGDLNGLYLNRDLQPAAGFTVAASPDQETDPAVASDGAGTVVAYTRIDTSYPYDGAGRVRFRLFDRDLRRRPILTPAPPRRRAAGR